RAPADGARSRGTAPPRDRLPVVGEPVPAMRRTVPGRASVRSSAPSTPRRKRRDRKSTRLNSSHVSISYAVFCLKKKKKRRGRRTKKNKARKDQLAIAMPKNRTKRGSTTTSSTQTRQTRKWWIYMERENTR